MEATFVVVGGGIAGVTCVETLLLLKPDSTVMLISESPLVKVAVNLQAVTKTLTSFDVVEQHISVLSNKYTKISVLHDNLTHIDSNAHTITTKGNKNIKYKYLCLCMGARPKIIHQGENSSFVLGIRDTDSVETLTEKLKTTQRLAVVGNGGIATELIHKLQNVAIDWIIKDNHITATFVDAGASEFFKKSLDKNVENPTYCTRLKYEEDTKGSGAALGPDWYKSIFLSGANPTEKSLEIHYETEIKNIEYDTNNTHPLKIELNNGEMVNSDLLVSATGVVPKGNSISTDLELSLSDDYGIKVNKFMATNLPDIFAAGDVCTPMWEYATHWFPMKLWSQAMQMGLYAAKCMIAKMDNEEIMQDFCFELFSHSTNLFGYKVVLLGLYNGQKLGRDYECLIRMTHGLEYIKFVLKDNRLQGAILIGDTTLAETCENLILNQLDLSPYGDDILNPDIDIEDYFD